MRYAQDARPGKILWFKNILLAGIFASLLLSEKLWVTTRSYPPVPVIPRLPSLPYPFDYIFFYAILATILCAIFWPKPRKFLIASAVGLGILAILDQTRWQPEFYEYFFLLITLCFFDWKKTAAAADANNATEHKNENKKLAAVLATCQFIIIAVYFWSGLQKVNPSFVNVVFPFILHPLSRFMSYGATASILSFGSLAPFAETIAGIGLLTRRFRNLAVMFTILMHAFILYAIGPLGNNWNDIIWPWQILMMAFVWILFWDNDRGWKEIILWKSVKKSDASVTGTGTAKNYLQYFHYGIILLFGIMPLFSFFGLWDSDASFALYSGNVNNAIIYMNNDVIDKVPLKIQEFAIPSGPDGSSINALVWSLAELNVPPYPEARIFKAIAKSLCAYRTSDPSSIKLTIYWSTSPTGAMRSPTSYDCADL